MASSGKSPSLYSLPSELLLSIVGYATLNGDLASLRVVSSSLNHFIIQQRQALSHILHRTHGLSSRILGLYYQHRNSKPTSTEGLVLLSQEIAAFQSLCEDEAHLMEQNRSCQTLVLTSMIWFSTFTSMLKASVSSQQSLKDILAPSETLQTAVPLAFDASFKDFLNNNINLTELESVISAINITASKLWSSVFLYKPHASRVNTFASLSGHTFNIEQAILTEHVIWHGPAWAAKTLKVRDTDRMSDFERLLHNHGPWVGSNEDGARLAANGLARLLWKERLRKVDEEHEKQLQKSAHQIPVVASLAVNPVVWRGSSGDL